MTHPLAVGASYQQHNQYSPVWSFADDGTASWSYCFGDDYAGCKGPYKLLPGGTVEVEATGDANLRNAKKTLRGRVMRNGQLKITNFNSGSEETYEL
jgi:hypothetical protein